MSRHYAVTFAPSAVRALKKLPQDIRARLFEAIEALAHDPRPAGVEKLSGDDNAWRVRVGDYRVLYEIHDRRLLVLVLTAGHRHEIYRKNK